MTMPESQVEAAGQPSRFGAGFLRGCRDILPILISTVPFGIIYGALAAQTGLTTTEAVLTSGLTFAGASQFVALQFWAHPLPFWTILLSVLAVNLRHVLYSAALGRKTGHWTAWQFCGGFGLLTDPTFALAELKAGPRLDFGYYLGLSLPLYVNWIVMTALGAVFGGFIGNPETIGLDFVVTAYFIHLVVSFRKRHSAAAVILASAAGALLVYLTAGPPWHIAGGAAAGMALAAALSKPKAQPA